MKQIYNLTEEQRQQRMQELLEKYMSSNSEKQRKTKWKDREFVTRVIKEHIKYLTVDRNIGVEDEESIITEEAAFKYLRLFNTRSRPSLDRLSEILDEEPTIGRENANKICMFFRKDSRKFKRKIRIKNKDYK